MADHPAEPHTLSDPNTKQATVAKIDGKESKKLDHIKKPVGPAKGIPASTLAIMDKYSDVFYDYEPRVQSSPEEGGESRTGKGFSISQAQQRVKPVCCVCGDNCDL